MRAASTARRRFTAGFVLIVFVTKELPLRVWYGTTLKNATKHNTPDLHDFQCRLLAIDSH